MKSMLFLGFLWVIIDCGCSHEARPPVSHALEFKESSAIRKICGVDNGGHPVYTKYEKPVLVLNGKVNSVEIINNSSSLVLENDTAVLTLDQPYSDNRGQQFLTLIIRYDRAALLDPDAFQKGDTWKITLTTNGELVGYEKPNHQIIPRGNQDRGRTSMPSEAWSPDVVRTLVVNFRWVGWVKAG